MNVNEAVALAGRIESLIRRTETFGKSKSDVLDELLDMANNLRDYADRLDVAMYNELGHAYEKYQNAMYNELKADADAYNARREV